VGQAFLPVIESLSGDILVPEAIRIRSADGEYAARTRRFEADKNVRPTKCSCLGHLRAPKKWAHSSDPWWAVTLYMGAK
jgi:hypothetical protein